MNEITQNDEDDDGEEEEEEEDDYEHTDQDEQDNSNSTEPISSKKENGKSKIRSKRTYPYKCTKCNKRFVYKEVYEAHNRIHKGLPGFS